MDFFDHIREEGMKNDEIEVIDKQRQEFKLIGRIRKRPGHTMFSYNLRSGEVKVAEVLSRSAINYMTKKPIANAKIVIEKDCIYRQALNKKNFVKRLIREGIPAKFINVCAE